MDFRKFLGFWLLALWIFSVGEVVVGLPPCNYPAMYNFGDSNSDTGGISAAFLQVSPPNGQTFFGRPSGRACDGRLILDFLAEELGLPYLSAYLDSLGAKFEHGANFATGGSTIRPQNGSLFEGGVSPFSLNVQLWQFDQFKARATDLYNNATNTANRNNLPNPEDYAKALYTIDIGQNDLSAGFRKVSSDAQVVASIPDIIDELSTAIQKLYEQGARTFWIHNTGPIGCLPMSRMYFAGDPGLLDPYGCIKPHNDVAVEFNRQLKERVIRLRTQLTNASLTYVDVYTAKYGLISDAKNQGFVDPLKICCGHHEGYHVWCGQKSNINGTEVYGGSCGDPSAYISWDGVHYSEAANHWIANHILNGALSDPPIPLAQACHKSVSSN